MLTVPDEIKENLHLDTCKKNIRIHFPNGERADICNDLIVMNSVKFTESLCSQDELKFGLCEAPQFECETVGVGNIKGATIEVYCEVYCDATVSGAVWQVDLQAWVYPIPYGVFIVSDAKRQADMNHRKIMAYSSIDINDFSKIDRSYVFFYNTYYSNYYTYVKANNYEDIKNIIPRRYGGDYQFDVIKRLYNHSSKMPPALLTMSAYSSMGYGQFASLLFYRQSDSLYIRLNGVTQNISGGSRDSNLYYVEIPESTYTQDELYERFVNEIYTNCASFMDSSELYDTITTLRKFIYFQPDANSNFYGSPVIPYVSVTTSLADNIFSAIYEPTFYLYPYNKTSDSTDDTNTTVGFNIPWRITLEVTRNLQTVYSDTVDIRNAADCKYRTCSTPYSCTSKEKRVKNNSINRKGYIPSGEWSPETYQNVFNAFFETLGLFGKTDRDNKFDGKSIKQLFDLRPSNTLYPSGTLYPGAPDGGTIAPNDYQSCWYDDEYTIPYGAVQCQYKNTNDEDCLYIQYLTGYDENTDTATYRVYDLTGNAIIGMATWTEANIQSICTMIAANIEGVSYMPVEFTGRGLPYVEAGDTFEILTKSNDSITTIVLNRTISGEQVLTDSYKSV